MACFNNWSVYDFYNMGQAVRKDMITGKEAFPYEQHAKYRCCFSGNRQ